MKYIPSILFCCLLIPCFGQVFPGDANNNGIVDHCDILPIGYAFGEVGPARLEESNEAYEQVVTVLWEEAFPDGNNYAHADANGDGIVDFIDLTTVFYNYDISYEETIPLPLISGTPGIDVPLYFDMPNLSEPLTAGSTLDIPLYLGTESIPVNNLHGLAFTIEYQSDFFESVEINLNPEWLSTDALFLFEAPVNLDEDGTQPIGELDVAITHFGKENSSSGYGQIGTMSIIIQDVLVDLMPINDSADVVLSIRKIAMYNQEFELESVVEDSVQLMIYHPEALTSTTKPEIAEPGIYPNPTKGNIIIESDSAIEWVELYDSKGAKVLEVNGKQEQKLSLDLQERNITPGLYTAILYNKEGQHIKKLAYAK